MQRDAAKANQDVIMNALLIFEKLNINIVDMAQTISHAYGQTRRSKKVSRKLQEIAFESSLLALNASREKDRARAMGEQRAISLTQQVCDIATIAAAAARHVQYIAGARVQFSDTLSQILRRPAREDAAQANLP